MPDVMRCDGTKVKDWLENGNNIGAKVYLAEIDHWLVG